MMRDPVVFVVDDNADVRESLTWLLESVGLTVQAFSTAGQFLEEYDPDQPGCLVLDVRMPGQSGLDVQRLLISAGHDVPIIFITGHGDIPMAAQALKAGAVDILAKPFDDGIFLKAVEQCVAKSRRRRA